MCQSKASVQNLHTNSIIQIQSDATSEGLLFGWRRKHPKHAYPFDHPTWTQNRSHQYQCSPLDYQCQIQLRIQHDGQYEYFKYGPIKLQGQLQTHLQRKKQQKQNGGPQHRLQLTKRANAIISICRNRGEKATYTVEVCEPSTEQKISFFWAAVQQPGRPSLLIMSEAEKLMLRMGKAMGEYADGEGYVEVGFGSRMDRDLFVCEVMEGNGVGFNSDVDVEEEFMKILSDEQPQIQASIMFAQSPPPPSNTLYESKKESAFMGSLERDMEGLIQSDSDTSPEQVIQDIYEILYTPNASKSISLQAEKSQRNLHSEHLQPSNKRISELQKTLKHNQYVTLLNSCKSEFGHINDMNSHDTRSKRNSRIVEESMEMSRSTIYENEVKNRVRPPSNMYLDPNNLYQTREIREESTFVRQSKQRIQLEPETNVSFHHGNQNRVLSHDQKVSYLTKLNMYLLEENERLREENRKLKECQGNSDLNKSEFTIIKETRKLITDMANRISFLEGMSFANCRSMAGPFQQSRNQYKQKPYSPPPSLQFRKSPQQTNGNQNFNFNGNKPPSTGFKREKKEENGQLLIQPEKKPSMFQKINKNLNTKQSSQIPKGTLRSVQSQKTLHSGSYQCPSFISPESRRGTEGRVGRVQSNAIKQPEQPFQQAIQKAQNFLSVPKASGEGETLPSSPTQLSFGGKK